MFANRRPYSKYVLGWWFTQHFSTKTCSQDSPRARACLRQPDLGPIAFWNQASSVPTILRIADLKRLNSNNLKLQSRSFLRFIHLATSNFSCIKMTMLGHEATPIPFELDTHIHTVEILGDGRIWDWKNSTHKFIIKCQMTLAMSMMHSPKVRNR